ncbi:MAG: aspartate/glutamate racemase family protein [Thermomicrobiales bacterium]|nr:aspartate/glutamate racemase family protein [Thermomicrobiales bacterium]
MYGARGRIGLITLASDSSVLPEYQRLMPDGVVIYPAPILLPRGEVTPAALAEMLEGDQLERAAELLTWTEVGVILFACTTGSLVHGVGWDRELVGRIHGATGVPATTTTTAVLDALRAVEATTLAVATPYLPELNAIERQFLEESGFAVSAIAGLNCGVDREIGLLTPEDAVALVAQVDTPEADAIFISCTNFHCLSAVAEIERVHGKPVITSNLAGAWATLRALGIDDDRPDAGHLFTLPARERMLAT